MVKEYKNVVNRIRMQEQNQVMNKNGWKKIEKEKLVKRNGRL